MMVVGKRRCIYSAEEDVGVVRIPLHVSMIEKWRENGYEQREQRQSLQPDGKNPLPEVTG